MEDSRRTQLSRDCLFAFFFFFFCGFGGGGESISHSPLHFHFPLVLPLCSLLNFLPVYGKTHVCAGLLVETKGLVRLKD